jgi:hypothetical protein
VSGAVKPESFEAPALAVFLRPERRMDSRLSHQPIKRAGEPAMAAAGLPVKRFYRARLIVNAPAANLRVRMTRF